MLKFPYGISDFYKVITEGYFYIDRTDRIRLLEETGPQLLFLRPRRFGKSLLLAMLENYYDVARADQFEQLFGHLAIGQNPTPLHNQYLVMRWDFSIVLAQGSAEMIKRALFDHINVQIENFERRYQAILPNKVEINETNAIYSLEALLGVVQQTPYSLYLMIDEYDNFANEVLMSSLLDGRKRYEELVSGEGIFKTLFKNIKAGSAGRGIDRVFITGVSPLVLSDMSSGYNVAENIYLMEEFNDLCGFTEAEVVNTLQQIAQSCNFAADKIDEALMMMRTFYNGYRFSLHSTELIYNSTLALYFWKDLQRRCAYPDEMLDNNLAMDRTRIVYVSQLGGAEQLVLQALNEQEPLTVTTLAQRFGIADVLAGDKSIEYLAALLYYLGVLTLDGQTPLRDLILKVPNLVVRGLYVERLRELFLPNWRDQDAGRQAARVLFQTGDLQPLCDFMQQRYFKVFDNRDYLAANELTVKTAFLTLLFDDRLYLIDSEPALARTYADLTLIRRPELRTQPHLLDLVLEFKFVKLKEVERQGQTVQRMTLEELKTLDKVQEKLGEARTQVQHYRQTLASKYGDTLNLHAYAVVALGFERLVWEEV